MGIHSKGSAGHKGTVVLAGDDLKLLRFMGKHRENSIDLVRKPFIQHIQIEHIVYLHKVKVGEHLLRCHAGMGSKNRMGAFTAHG